MHNWHMSIQLKPQPPIMTSECKHEGTCTIGWHLYHRMAGAVLQDGQGVSQDGWGLP